VDGRSSHPPSVYQTVLGIIPEVPYQRHTE